VREGWIPLSKAAKEFDSSTNALRMQIKRGQRPGEKINGRWYTPDKQNRTKVNAQPVQAEMITELRRQIEFLTADKIRYEIQLDEANTRHDDQITKLEVDKVYLQSVIDKQLIMLHTPAIEAGLPVDVSPADQNRHWWQFWK